MSYETQLADSFVEYYYRMNNENKEELASIYTEASLITFQDTQIMGINPRNGSLNIMERLTGEALGSMIKKPIVWQAQQSVSDTFLVCVQGSVRMSQEEAEELSFYEVFLIGRNEEGNFFIINQIFSTSGV